MPDNSVYEAHKIAQAEHDLHHVVSQAIGSFVLRTGRIQPADAEAIATEVIARLRGSNYRIVRGEKSALHSAPDSYKA